MLEQTLRNRQPNALQGLGLIALVALAVLAGSAFFSLMQKYIGTLASVGFIAYGCVVAWFLLNWYVMGFIYTSNRDCLRVCRVYGKRERFMTDVWLNQVISYGTLEDMKRRVPRARIYRATRAQCEYGTLALAYKESGKPAIIVIQPDEAMRKHLIESIKLK